MSKKTQSIHSLPPDIVDLLDSLLNKERKRIYDELFSENYSEYKLVEVVDKGFIDKDTRCRCGKALRYAYIIEHQPTEERFILGVMHFEELFDIQQSINTAFQKEMKKINAMKEEIILHTQQQKYQQLDDFIYLKKQLPTLIWDLLTNDFGLDKINYLIYKQVHIQEVSNYVEQLEKQTQIPASEIRELLRHFIEKERVINNLKEWEQKRKNSIEPFQQAPVSRLYSFPIRQDVKWFLEKNYPLLEEQVSYIKNVLKNHQLTKDDYYSLLQQITGLPYSICDTLLAQFQSDNFEEEWDDFILKIYLNQTPSKTLIEHLITLKPKFNLSYIDVYLDNSLPFNQTVQKNIAEVFHQHEQEVIQGFNHYTHVQQLAINNLKKVSFLTKEEKIMIVFLSFCSNHFVAGKNIEQKLSYLMKIFNYEGVRLTKEQLERLSSYVFNY